MTNDEPNIDVLDNIYNLAKEFNDFNILSNENQRPLFKNPFDLLVHELEIITQYNRGDQDQKVKEIIKRLMAMPLQRQPQFILAFIEQWKNDHSLTLPIYAELSDEDKEIFNQVIQGTKHALQFIPQGYREVLIVLDELAREVQLISYTGIASPRLITNNDIIHAVQQIILPNKSALALLYLNEVCTW